ncbi:AMP-binding protein, partial [Fulvivirga lutimaris]|uniref:AMP-binding protein n=1 Tax=Fulvivirga lutimaris TaxID=1819566 RepID=UPI0012BBE3CA
SQNSKIIIEFINSWQSGQQRFEFQTSGSTGEPKNITISRTQMESSANMTIKALNLEPNSTSLLCMNPAFIGGKMMIVRSLINQMNLVVVEPSSNPLKGLDEPIDFAALVPLQLANIFESKQTFQKLKNISNVIVGGGQVSDSLRQEIKSLDNSIYATYGMTETVSHIGLQLLSKQSDEHHFTTLDDVQIASDARGCLTIKSAVTNNTLIVTNDRVEIIDSNKFKWLGRIDNVINSGGIKIQIEQVESTISKIMNSLDIGNRFILKGIKDDLLGEKVTLIIEGIIDDQSLEMLSKELGSSLHKYQKPKEIHFINKLEETPTSKIVRNTDYNAVKRVTI